MTETQEQEQAVDTQEQARDQPAAPAQPNQPDQAAAAAQTPPAPPTQSAAAQSATPATLADDPLRRSPFLAAVLSLVPGLGQIYLGYTRLGFVHAIVISTILTLLAAEALGPLVTLGATFLGFFWLFSVVDAARRAVLFNQALLGRVHLDLPETVGEPGLRGSIVGGAAIVAVGAILLSNTLFDVSLRWVEDWWPAAVIGFGAYLIYRAVQDRVRSESDSEPEPDSDLV